MNEPQPLLVISQALSSPEMRGQFLSMLPKNVEVDFFTEVTMMALRQSPELLQADRQTLYDSCLTLARRGLLPDKKEAALVVFNTKDGNQWVKKVQALPMVEGIIKEMAKAGVKAYAVSVYKNDFIKFFNDDAGQHVNHEPVVFGDRGERVGCFAAGRTTDGRTYVEAMNNEDLAKIRSRSKQKDTNGNPTGTWRSDPERMEQKSALHRLRKRIPILDNAEALQDLKDLEEESDIDLIDPETQVTPEEIKAHTEELLAKARRPRALQAVVDQEYSGQSSIDVTGETGSSSAQEDDII